MASSKDIFSVINPENYTQKQKEANAISGEQISDALRDGKEVKIVNAIINGSIRLNNSSVDKKFSIDKSEVNGEIDFSSSTFKKSIAIKRSLIKNVLNLNETTFESNLSFNGTEFFEDVNCIESNLHGSFYCREYNGKVHFKKEANFIRTVFHKRLEFYNTVFDKKVDFDNITTFGNVIFLGTVFKGHTIFQDAQIKSNFILGRINQNEAHEFESSVFKSRVDFDSMSVNNIYAEEVVFEDKVSFYDATILGSLYFRSSTFKGNTNFSRTIIHRAAIFEGSSFLFEGENKGYINFTFTGIEIKEYADFSNSSFVGNLSFNSSKIECLFFKNSSLSCHEEIQNEDILHFDFGIIQINNFLEFQNSEILGNINFNSAKIDGYISFQKTHFSLKPSDPAITNVNFAYSQIGGYCNFESAVFEGSLSFFRADIKGSLFFTAADFTFQNDPLDTYEGRNVILTTCTIHNDLDFNDAIFEGNVAFNGMVVKGHAFFRNVLFRNQAKTESELNNNFIAAVINGNAEFNNSTFEGSSSFYGVTFGGPTYFTGCLFNDSDNAYTSFTGANFNGETYFTSAVINTDIEFTGSSFARELYLVSTNFNKGASFQNCKLKTFIFDENLLTSFKNGVDMRGCTYDRIDPIKYWKSFMNFFEPYGRQPFSQLEKTVRATGDDSSANKIYFEREKRRSSVIIKKKEKFWLIELFLHKLFGFSTGYGIKPWRLLYVLIPLLIVGSVLFQNEGAIRPKKNEKTGQMEKEIRLNTVDAFWFSLDNILPISIANGTKWEATDSYIPSFQDRNFDVRYVDLVRLFSILGWVLIPIGLAGVTGLLKKK